jgi:hypothetical protein
MVDSDDSLVSDAALFNIWAKFGAGDTRVVLALFARSCSIRRSKALQEWKRSNKMRKQKNRKRIQSHLSPKSN